MLKAIIRDNPFNTDIANEFFQKIRGNQYAGDDALVSVARAILPQRMGAEDSVQFRYTAKCIRPDRPFGGTQVECEAYISSDLDLDANDLVTIYYFTGVRREDSAPYMDAIQKHFVSKHPGWEENMKVRNGPGRLFPACAYANVEKRSVVIFLGEMDITRCRWAILSVFSSMPWYFDIERSPLTEDEQALLDCLTAHGNEAECERKFKVLMERLAARYDFEKIRVSRALEGFETRYERRAIESAKNAIANNDRRINELNAAIADQLKQRRDNEIRLCGLEMRADEAGEASAIRDLFLNNPRLYLDSICGDAIVFAVKTDLEYYDTDKLETFIANRNSCVYRDGGIPTDDMIKLLRAVFLDGIIKLQVCGAYQIEMCGGSEGIQHYEYPASFSDYMPNTHIDQHACLGNHRAEINACIQNGDYVGAIMQCIASCQSLNFLDSTVMNEFMQFMYRDRYTGLRLPDGRVVKPSAAIAWLKEQEAQDGQEEPEAPAEAEA